MKIYKVKSYEDKDEQQWQMVDDCRNHWRYIDNKYYQSYLDIMNMKTYRWNNNHDCYIAVTYHLEPNKW